ncbi:MAG: protein kinase [Proteobacteria bacterium]|nr:protein kinase [Pseudomonadota bacterium]MBU1711037.1 protein kinase [Pseudomonadota bacterium]
MLSNIFNKLVKPKAKATEIPEPAPPTSEEKNTPPPKKVFSPNWQPGDVIIDRYKVENVMSGSMGKVYICDHLGWGIKIAIKSPRPQVLADREGMKRILTEAKSWVHLGMHPNVAACYYVLSLEKIPHLFIEFIDGGSLDDWIKAGRCKDLRTTLSLAIQFCHGMEYTHSKGLIHRDIKPQNILVTKNALLKITDFGILLDQKKISGKDTGEKEAPLTLSEDDAENESTVGFRGTPGYASPEQFRDAHKVDRRTDIFSFGLCLWMMLCGQKPFKRNVQRNEIPEPVPANPVVTFPPILVELLKKSVAFDMEDRYPDFAAMRADLNEAYTSLFKVACPYAVLTNIDLRADSMNNRAVSLFELGREKEAVACLQHSLEINDLLPEAIYNLILLRWREGNSTPQRILRQIEATKKRFPKMTLLDDMELSFKEMIAAQRKKEPLPEIQFPEYKLCTPKVSVEIFREGQLYHSVQRSVRDHLRNKRFEECHNVLLTAWRNNGFKKDKILNNVYEQLLPIGEKESVAGAQRFLTLKGTDSPVTCLASVPGTWKIASSGPDGLLKLHDLSKPKQNPEILGEKNKPIHSLAVSSDGERLAFGTEDGKVRVWSINQGKNYPIEIAHKAPITALTFSPDNQWLVSGDLDGNIKFYGLATQKARTISIPESGGIRSINYLNKNLDLITGSDDSKLRIWSATDNEYIRIIEAHQVPLVTLSAAIDGNRFISVSQDHDVKVWESSTGRNLKSFQAHEETITSAIILPDKWTVVTGCEDDILKIWNSETGNCVYTLDGRGDGITSLALGPKPHTFLAGRQDGAILFWMIIYKLRFH